MISVKELKKLMRCFPNSFINAEFEFVADAFADSYFRLEDCNSEFDVKCKCLEWLSRDAFKTEPYRTKKLDEAYHQKILDGINKYLDVLFCREDMEIIYQHLGNAINHKKTIDFICSNFSKDVLIKDKKEN